VKLKAVIAVMLFGVLSAGAAEPRALATAPGSGLGEAAMRLTGALLIVVAMLFAALRFLKGSRWVQRAQAARQGLQIVESKSLGVRQSVVVVGYGQQRFLVGAGPQGMTMLTALPDAPAPKPEAQAAPEEPPAFGEMLLRAIQQR